MSGAPYRGLAGLDCIQLAGIAGSGRHGVYHSERENPQTFIADLDMYGDLRAARASDAVEDTADYSEIAAAVREVLEGEPHNLIESLADAVAQRVLAFAQVRVVRVRIHKPEAPLSPRVGDVAVTVWAGLEDLEEAPAPAGNEAPERPRDWMEHGVSGGGDADFPGLDRTPERPRSAVLALGANLGNREQTLRDVVGELDHWEGIGVTEVSPLVRTAAVLRPDQPSQPDYVNAVVLVQTMLSPRDLLGACQQLEDRHGRTRDEKWGPRTLDIDIISYEGVRSEDPTLQLPHPRAGSRAFVLLPWRHIRADAQLEGVGSVAELAEKAPDRGGIRSIHPHWLAGAGTRAGEVEPLPLPKWEAVRDEEPPRILDDPESLVLSDEPVDPRLSLTRMPSDQPLGIAGVSVPAGQDLVPAAASAYTPDTPSLWQRIKAFFRSLGRGAKAEGPVIDAPPVGLPQPLPPRVTPVVLDETETAAEGVTTTSLEQVPTVALEQVTPAAEDVPAAPAEVPAQPQPDAPAAAEADPAETPVGADLPAPADVPVPTSEEPASASDEADDLAEAQVDETPPAEDADEPAPATPPQIPVPPASTALADEDAEAETTQPLSLADLADAADEVPRPAPEPAAAPVRASLKDRLQNFSPVPPPVPAPAPRSLPVGLAQKAQANRHTWEDAEQPTASEGNDQPAEDEPPVPVPVPSPPPPPSVAPDQPVSARTTKAAESDLVERRSEFRRARHAGKEVPQEPPPPPLGDAPEPPTTQEVSKADIADAANRLSVTSPDVLRPTTTGTIPVLRPRGEADQES